MAQSPQLLNAININNVLYPIGSIAFFVCSDEDNVVNKTAVQYGSSSGIATFLNIGMTIHVYFTYTNTAINPTLNLCSLGAVPIYCYEDIPAGITPESSWQAGSVVSLTYTGAAWVMNDFKEGETDEALTTNQVYTAVDAAFDTAAPNYANGVSF